MSASFVEMSVEGGLPQFRCPVTGIAVFDAEQGFLVEREQSPYLRFFMDWTADTWVPPLTALPEGARPLQRKLLDLLATEIEGNLTMNDVIRKCVEAMPTSAVVFELLDPPRGGGFDGSVCYVAFDFSGVHDNPAPVHLVPLEE